MKHTRSSAEWEIREVVVTRFRELWPAARIIHELNVDHGQTRADLVAVSPTRLVLCEIKSERDTLDRLEGQAMSFSPACHTFVVAAHAKWCALPARIEYRPGSWRQPPSPIQVHTRRTGAEVWEYPEPERNGYRDWRTFREHSPWAARMLSLLWVDELKAECSANRIAFGSRSNSDELRRAMLHLMRQPEIEAAVCRQLRARVFAEADAPIGAANIAVTSAEARLL